MTDQQFTLLKPIYIDALVSHLQSHLKRAFSAASPLMADSGVSLTDQAQSLRLQAQASDAFLKQFKFQLQTPALDVLQLQTAEQWLLQAVLQSHARYAAAMASYPSNLVLPAERATDALVNALTAPVLLRLWLLTLDGLPLVLQVKVALLEAWLLQLAAVQSDLGGLVEAWLRRAQAVPYDDSAALQRAWQDLQQQLQPEFPLLASTEASVDASLNAVLPDEQQQQLQQVIAALIADAQSGDSALAFAAQTALGRLQHQPFALLLPKHGRPALASLSLLADHRSAGDWLPLIDFLLQGEAQIAEHMESLACAANLSEQLQQARAAVVELLQERLGGAAWPELICEIVDEHWLPMLLEIDWRYGRASSEWLSALTALDELLAMLEPNLPLSARLELSEHLPQLLVKLRSLLVADASVDLVRRRQTRQVFSRLLDRLSSIHLALMQGEAWTESRIWQPPVEAEMPALSQANWWRHEAQGLVHCLYRDRAHAIVLALNSGKLQMLPLAEMAQDAWREVA